MLDISEFLERVDTLPLSYEMATVQEKRDILKTVTSNLTAEGKNVAVKLRSPFQEVANLDLVPTGAPVRGEPRTRTKKVFDLLVSYFTAQAKERQRQEDSVPTAA